MKTLQTDIIIIGGGLVGASIALALQASPYQVAIIEANSSQQLQDGDFDARSIALSDASTHILQSIGVWQDIQKKAVAIKKIHVSKQQQFGRTLLDAAKHQLSAFGHVAELSHLNQALQPKLETVKNLTHFYSTKLTQLQETKNSIVATIDQNGKTQQIEAKLLIAADGTNSFVRKLINIENIIHDYHQNAIIANIGLRRPHQNIAYERFTQNGLIAMLPMSQQRSALVWAVASQNTQKLMALSDDDFINQLQNEFGYRLGKFTKVGKRFTFPLGLQQLEKTCYGRVAFIGNAAQTLHPVAGQGFNLGLRDAAFLAELLAEQHPESLDCNNLAKQYENVRKEDKQRIIMSTNQLVNFFGLNHFPFPSSQSAGLIATDLSGLLQSQLIYHAMGYGDHNSKLACQIPLEG